MQIKNNVKYIDTDSTPSIPVKNIRTENHKILRKPPWIKIKLPINMYHIKRVKTIMREQGLFSVCEEASCPNLVECFSRSAITFMILGPICTRKCPFCNVAHGRPTAPDIREPIKLAQAIRRIGIRYVVLTSVNRDDLHDGGAKHFADCINEIRDKNPWVKVEILVPDFRGCMNIALDIINNSLPDVFNHNLESVPRLYHQVRPGANYNLSLKLLEKFKIANPHLPTKSGLMVGIGEIKSEIIEVMRDLRTHGVNMLTVGQYLQPSKYHLPVKRYLAIQEFEEIKNEALAMGFTNVACGPFVRSSYHASSFVSVSNTS